MRIVTLLAGLVMFGAGCQYHGGFVGGGAGWHHPSLDEDSNGAVTGGILYQVAGGIGFAETEEYWTGFEGWGAFSNAQDVGDLVIGPTTTDIETEMMMFGLGVRGLIGLNRQLYARMGVSYEELGDGDLVGDLSEAWGVYAGIGYQFYLDRGRHISIGPEILLHGQVRDPEGPQGTDKAFAATGSVFLTYHFGGDKRRKPTKDSKAWEGLPPLRDDIK